MQIIKDDERGLCNQPAWIAAKDIVAHNKKNESNFSEAQLKLAKRLHTLASEAHNSKVYSPNFRKNQISVKVAEYKARDKLSQAYSNLEVFCTKHNIVCRLTNNNKVAIYTIK